MTQHEHIAELVGTYKCEEGWYLQDVETCGNNTSFAVFETDNRKTAQRILLRGEQVIDLGPRLPAFSLSSDGKKLATAKPVFGERALSHEIAVNGEVVFTSTLSTISHLVWLDADRLAWEGWNESKNSAIDEDGIRTFVDGVDVTGTLEFEIVLVNQRLVTVVREIGIEHDGVYAIYDDGTTTPTRLSMKADESSSHRWHDWVWEQGERPEIDTDPITGMSRVRYQGNVGPWFKGIENAGSMTEFTYSADQTKVAYVAGEITGLGAMLGRVAQSYSARIEASEEANGSREEIPWWGAPFVKLFNPYNGPLYALWERSTRLRPVDGDRPWKKRYTGVGGMFYTSDGELAAVVQDGQKVRLAINEDEGPAYDAIHNARDNGTGVHYLAQKGDHFFRVAVHTVK